jgi:hypothetical protein
MKSGEARLGSLRISRFFTICGNLESTLAAVRVKDKRPHQVQLGDDKKSEFTIVAGMFQWLKERWREMRGNAFWDVVKSIGKLVIAVVLPVGYAVWNAIRQQPLQWLTVIFFVAVGAGFLFITRHRKPRSVQKNSAIEAFDGFDDLVRRGEAMMEKLKKNGTLAEREFQEWDNELLSLANGSATISERNSGARR